MFFRVSFRWLIFLGMFRMTCMDIRAQAITISEEMPMRSDYAYTILGWIGGDLLLFRDKGHDFYIQAFDTDMHIKWERELYLGDHKADIIGIVAHPNRFHIIYGFRDKGDYLLYHRSYAHDVSLVDSMMIGKVENVFLTPQFILKESEDENKIVLARDEGSTLQLLGYDLISRAVTWKHEIRFAGTNLVRDYSTMQVSNDGDFYLALQPDKFLQRAQAVEIYCSVGGAGSISHDVIPLGDVQMVDYYPIFDNVQKHLIVTGLYSERGSDRAQGFYFIKYQAGTFDTHLLPFDDTILADVHGHEVTASKGLTDFTVQQVALRQDGGAVIIAELNKEFSRRSTIPLRRDNGSFSRGSWVDYYYEDLVLFAVHPDGTEHWKDVLRKRQYSQDDDAIYSSFFLFKTPSRLRFLFNDEIKQENTVGGYEVTGTGHVERKTVFNTDYQRLKLRFKDGVQLAYNECVVPSERNSRLSLVRIVYNE